MEEDDDVVYEGSALYEHLQATGFTDFEADSRLNHVERCEEVSTVQAPGDVNNTIDNMSIFCDSSIVKQQELDELRQRVAQLLLGSGLINKDDVLFLEHFSPSLGKYLLQDDSDVQPKLNDSNKPKTGVISKSLSTLGWLSLAISVFIGVSVMEEQDSEDNKLKRRWQLLILGVIMTVIFIVLRVRGKMKQPYKDVLIKLDDLLSHLQAMSLLCKSSLRILQETYLISKGFVLVTGSEKLQTGVDNEEFFQCRTLREALSHMMWSSSKLLSTSHNALSTFRSKHKYHVIPDLFGYEDKDRQDMQASNLKELKIQKDILNLQISTVLTELMLRLESSNMFCDSFLNSFHEIFDCDLYKETQSLCNIVLKNADYMRSYWSSNEFIEEKMSQTSIEEKKTDVYTAVHSLILHMQSALHKTKLVENSFSENVDNQEGHGYEEIKNHMDVIKAEIDLSLCCWEEAMARLDRKHGKISCNEEAANLQNSSTVEDKKVIQQNTQKVYELEDPVIEDEVFEALIEEEDTRTFDEDDDDIWLSNYLKEREKLRHQKEQGKRVLKELQPILVKRREMWEERENVALKRMNKETNEEEINFGNTTELSLNKIDNTDHIQEEDIPYNINESSLHDELSCDEVESEELVPLNNLNDDVTLSSMTLDYEDNVNFGENILKFQDKITESLVINDIECAVLTDNVCDKSSPIDNNDVINDEKCKQNISLYNTIQQRKGDMKTSPAALDLKRRDSYDSDDERLEVYHRVKSELLQNEDQGHEISPAIVDIKRRNSYDSDDERLDDYHKVRMSLNEVSVDNNSDNSNSDNEHILIERNKKVKGSLDWDLPPLPAKVTLEDRLNIISDSQCLNFQAQLAAQAVAASRTLKVAEDEECFGGIGDGEVYGSESETSDSEN